MKTRLIILIIACVPMLVSAQSWQLLKQVKHSAIDKFALDQTGNVYVTNQQGEVSKYSPGGKLMVEYAPLQMASIHEVMANTQFKVVLFYKDLQEFVFLNRYLSNPVRYRLSDFDLGYVEDVAPNFQQALWVLDISDFSLKLVDLRESRLLEQKSLAQVLDQNTADIVSFHSHQNRMYVIDKASGVHVFDNIGNYLFQLMPVVPLNVGFSKDFLYYQKDEFLNLVHLYDGENMKMPTAGLSQSRVGYSNGRLVAITPQGFNIYQYLSGQ